MFQMVAPLAVSAHVPNMCGELHCFSSHNKVINLINEKDEIITLHNYGCGLSPMGWALKSNDFYYLYEEIQCGSNINQLENGNLLIGDVCIINNHRRLTLAIKNKFILSSDILIKLLKPIDNQTGLFGSLNQHINTSLSNNLQPIVEQFVLLLKQQKSDITPYIGLGPGLTPSYDDMIMGILAVLHSDPRLVNLPHLLSTTLPIIQLELLTTKISATFLKYAIQGIFTSNMLAVISLIRQYKLNSLTINKLLSYGHTSGVDLLLGIWLGSIILQESLFGKGMKLC